MDIQVIANEEEFNRLIDEKHNFYLLKHSLTCPVSTFVKRQYDQFSEKTDIPCYILHVQEARPLSNQIAEKYDVRHESPQALLFHDKEIVWHDSHGAVTVEALEESTNRLT
ncbi:bacillithiol system redox-active protein YtxJ [Halobacillus sp. MO56]